jgi:hypothetical protein
MVTLVWIIGLIVVWEIGATIIEGVKRTPENVLPHLYQIVESIISTDKVNGTQTALQIVLSNAGIISSLIVPADAMYRKTVSLVLASTSNPLSGLMMIGPFGAQLPPNIWMVVWSLLYLVGCVGLASLLFSRKEI